MTCDGDVYVTSKFTSGFSSCSLLTAIRIIGFELESTSVVISRNSAGAPFTIDVSGSIGWDTSLTVASGEAYLDLTQDTRGRELPVIVNVM